MDNIPLRYLNPEDCDRAENAGRKYASFSCKPAPGGGNECIGEGTGGQFNDCKQCLQNCSNDPGSGDESEPEPDVTPVESIPFQKTTTGKIVIGSSVIIILVLLVLLVLRMRKEKSISEMKLTSSFEKIMWRRK